MIRYLLAFLLLFIPSVGESRTLKSSERFFRSELFKNWWEMQELAGLPPQSPKQRRKAYHNYLMLAQNDAKVAHAFFAKATLFTPLEKYFDSLFPNDLVKRGEISPEEFGRIVDLYYQKGLKIPGLDGPIDDKTKNPVWGGNLPYKLFDLGKTALLRIPNVTDPKLDISKEFTNHIAYLQQTGRHHLYINVMSGLSGDKESKQCRDLNAFQSEGLTVVTLDKDSDFYWQEGIWMEEGDAETFLVQFQERLLSQSDTNFWPDELQTIEWHDKVENIIRRTYEENFSSSSELSQIMRQDLIELVYVELIWELIDVIKPDFANISCKNTIDRGPSLIALLYLKNQHTFTGQQLHKMLSLVLAQPILMRNRVAHSPRIERMARAAMIMLSHKQHQQ